MTRQTRLLTIKQERQIIELYAENIPITVIGKIVCPERPVPESTIRSALKRNKIKPRKRLKPEGFRDQTAKRVDQIIFMYVELEMSSGQIAEKLSLHPTVVARYVRMRGVTRSISEASRLAYATGRKKRLTPDEAKACFTIRG